MHPLFGYRWYGDERTQSFKMFFNFGVRLPMGLQNLRCGVTETYSKEMVTDHWTRTTPGKVGGIPVPLQKPGDAVSGLLRFLAIVLE